MNENGNMSPADVMAITNGKGNSGDWFGWMFLIFIVLAWGGNGFGGGRGVAPAPANYVTQSEMQNALNNQSVQAALNQIGQGVQQSNYETAQLINGQTNTFLQQRNTDALAWQAAFDNLSQQVSQQTGALSAKVDQVVSHMDACCSSITTKMMQQQLDEANRKLLEEQNKNNIAQQTQQILGIAGRWVGWAGNGSQASATAG